MNGFTVFSMKGFLNLVSAVVPAVVMAAATASLLFTPMPVEAKIYKCVAGNGSVSYSQAPCPTNEKTSKVLQGKAVQERFDCRITRAFSSHVADQMKAGLSSKDLYSHYGGTKSLSSTSMSVINYVFGHEGNDDTSVNQIVALSGARCESGAYSQEIDCEHFPASFIDTLGGCPAAKGEAVHVAQANQYSSLDSSSQPELGEALPEGSIVNTGVDFGQSSFAIDTQSLTQKNYNVLKESAAEEQTNCRTIVMGEIRAIQTKMRGHHSLDERNDMNDKRSELRDQFEAC